MPAASWCTIARSPATGLTAGDDPRLEFRPEVGRKVVTLAARLRIQWGRSAGPPSGESILDHPDDAGRTFGDDQQRITEPASARILEERAQRGDVFLGARHQAQEGPCVRPRRRPMRPAQPRATSGRSRGDAVDEQVDDGVPGKIALAGLVFGPLGDLVHRRPRQKLSARLVGEGVFDVARRQARA